MKKISREKILFSVLLIVLLIVLISQSNKPPLSVSSDFKGQINTLAISPLTTVCTTYKYKETMPDGEICNAGYGCEVCIDDTFRCYDNGYVRCGETNVCGPSQTWCSNYFSDKSCNLDKSSCCNDANWIYDYGSAKCCPTDFPFRNSGDSRCYTTPQSGSDNWYTKNSQCATSSCSGLDFISCESLPSDPFLNINVNKGIIKGQCGAECSQDEVACDNGDYLACGVNGKFVNLGQDINKCWITCSSNSDCPSFNTCIESKCVPESKNAYYRLDNKVCTLVDLYSSEVTKNDFKTKEECEKNISGNNYLYIIVIVLVIMVISYFIINKRKR